MRPDLEWENEYYRRALAHPTIGQIGRTYLESRGLTQDTIDKWEIGWSPVGCIPSNFSKEDHSTPWKKHWGRITFPIRDQNGTMVSISGRQVIKLEGRPKYDHYPFPARKILFGLFNNKAEVQKADRIIITEGQIDVISSWQQGLRIVTSSFGAHCSLDHFSIAARYASTIDIIYDEDNAGRKGTQSVTEFPTWGDLTVNLRTGIFPPGEDLDNWIRTHEVDELFRLIDSNESEQLLKKLRMIGT